MQKDLPLSIGTRVFEQYLCEGNKALYRAQLAIFKWSWDLQKIPVKLVNGLIDEQSFWEHVRDGCSLQCMPQTALLQFLKYAGKVIDDEQKFVDLMLSIKFKTKYL